MKKFVILVIFTTKVLELRNSNNHNYLSMSAEEVSTSVIFRGCFEEMNFKIFSLLSSEVSDIKEEVLELDFYSNIIFSINYESFVAVK